MFKSSNPQNSWTPMLADRTSFPISVWRALLRLRLDARESSVPRRPRSAVYAAHGRRLVVLRTFVQSQSGPWLPFSTRLHKHSPTARSTAEVGTGDKGEPAWEAGAAVAVGERDDAVWTAGTVRVLGLPVDLLRMI